MAVIARADPLQRLIRKIGYSVGLENLVERVGSLVTIYAQNKELTAARFRTLIEFDPNFLRKTAVEHFANFYSTLNLVRTLAWDSVGVVDEKGASKQVTVPKILEPMYQLDSLSILRRLFATNDERYSVALKVVLAQSIIEADGDIFLNALLSDFQEPAFKRRLELMIRTKRELLHTVIRTPAMKARIDQIVNIKNESGKGNKNQSEKSPTGRFERRTAALGTGRRIESLSSEADDSVAIPSDYLDKASKTRRAWAEDLGFFARKKNGESGPTEQGKRLIECLGRGGASKVISNIDGVSTAIFWGYQSDLEQLRIDPSKIKAGAWEAWDLLSAIAAAYQANGSSKLKSKPSPEDIFSLLTEIFRLYKEGNSSKGLILNSLPLYVAEPVIVGWCVANEKALPNLAAILDQEFKRKVRRVQKMIIRGTAGALFFARPA